MIVVALLLALAIFDGMLAGFRAAAGRDGRIDKGSYIRAALLRGMLGGIAAVALDGALAAMLVVTSPDRDATWTAMLGAGTAAIWVFGAFATLTLLSIVLWFSPVHEHRLLSTMIVLGPLTLVRPVVIVAGLAVAAATASEPRVWILAAIAAITMRGLESALGRAHAKRWRTLV